jgi:hypothetical protein
MRTGNDSGRARRLATAIATLALMAALACAGSASAKTVYSWTYSGTTFNANDASPGEELDFYFQGLRDLRIDQATNALYSALTPREVVFGQTPLDRLYKFNFAGKSTPWAAHDPDTWFAPTHANNEYAVDNTGGPTQGRIYALNTSNDQGIFAFDSSGQEIVDDHFPLRFNTLNMCGIAVDPQGDIWVNHFVNEIGFEEPTGYLEELNPQGEKTGQKIWTEATTPGSGSFPCELQIDTAGVIYYAATEDNRIESLAHGHGGITTFLPDGTKIRGALDPQGAVENMRIAIDTSNDDVFIANGRGTVRQYDSEGGLEGEFPLGGAGVNGNNATGIAVDADSHALFAARGNRIEKYVRSGGIQVPTAKTVKADVASTTATLHGVVNGDGLDTTECYFEWGPGLTKENTNTNELTGVAPCAEGNVFTGGSGDHDVHANLAGLTFKDEYHFRLVAGNANGKGRGRLSAFKASSPATVTNVTASNVETGGAHLVADVVPNGSYTHFKFEVGPEPGNYTTSLPPTPPQNAVYDWRSATPKHVDVPLSGLESGTTYYFRFVAVNDAGTTTSTVQKFTTFSKDPAGDACANAHVRQQTGTRLLLDCRAYELVSAANAGGYDVESDLSLGRSPLVTSPLASGRAIYSLHFGTIPGLAGDPTNFGHDPYLAVRGPGGWATEYAGLPAGGMADDEHPYGSPLLGHDANLTVFAFGGPHICDPCFEDGSTNIPLRRGGLIEKGMRGSQEPPGEPFGTVQQPFSEDGSHFVFGTKALYETGGDSSGSIYDRNLGGGGTQVVSKLPNGATMTGGQVAELGISSDGSRIVVAQQVGTDAENNALWHPYLHIGTSPNTIDLAPGTTGVLYAGMSADGTRVFYATSDKLLAGDTDSSADLYEAAVPGGGPASLSLVSVDGTTPSNSDACTPSGNWNVASGGSDCSALPLAGGAGVARNGSVYFLSPEQLDGSEGEAGEANLYLKEAGEPTKFVATLDTGSIDNSAVVHALEQNGTRDLSDFQASSSGRYAIFSSTESLTGYPTGGHQLLYRFDDQSGLDCASCPVSEITATADTMPAPYGLGLSDGGKVFFTTTEQLVLRDTNKKADAYEWVKTLEYPDSKQQLISSGVSPLDSHLLGISSDGVDAFFFTHEKLAAEDQNGNAVKLYTARENGGFPFVPAEKACAASDECHGPGTEPPPDPNINTFTGGGPSRGNAKSNTRVHCKKRFVKRKGKCVKRKKSKKHGKQKAGRGGRNG